MQSSTGAEREPLTRDNAAKRRLQAREKLQFEKGVCEAMKYNKALDCYEQNGKFYRLIIKPEIYARIDGQQYARFLKVFEEIKPRQISR